MKKITIKCKIYTEFLIKLYIMIIYKGRFIKHIYMQIHTHFPDITRYI